MIQLEVDSTQNRPLRADVFDWLYLLYAENGGFQEPPPIPRADKKGGVGIQTAEMHRNARADEGRFLMLGVEPPLNLTSYLSTNEVRGLQKTSQRIPEEYRGIVAVVRRHVGREGSIDREIISRLQPLNDLGRGAVSHNGKHERQSGPGD